MPRAPGPRKMQRDLDRILAKRLAKGTQTQVAGDKVVEVDLSAAFLEIVRKRLKDAGAARPPTPAEKKADARQREVSEAIERAMARQPEATADKAEVKPPGYDLPEHDPAPKEHRRH